MSTYRLGETTPDLPPSDAVWIAPSADIIGDVRLGEGATVWFQAVLRADNEPMIIGARSNIQDGSVLHSDPGAPLVVGEGVTVGHKVVLHGCIIGNNSLIGIGAIILNRAVIGRDSIVGAGSLVPEGKVFPDGVLLLGSPARVIRELSVDEIAKLRRSADHYVANGRRFATMLQPC